MCFKEAQFPRDLFHDKDPRLGGEELSTLTKTKPCFSTVSAAMRTAGVGAPPTPVCLSLANSPWGPGSGCEDAVSVFFSPLLDAGKQ